MDWLDCLSDVQSSTPLSRSQAPKLTPKILPALVMMLGKPQLTNSGGGGSFQHFKSRAASLQLSLLPSCINFSRVETKRKYGGGSEIEDYTLIGDS